MDDADGPLIDELYRAFASYGRPATFEWCGCELCPWTGVTVSDTGWNGTKRPVIRVDSPGGNRPVRDLSEEEIAGIVLSALPSTAEELDLFKHYLPRVLHILAEGGWADWPDDELVVRWVSQASRFADWSDEERTAVARFLDQFVPPEHGTDRSCGD